MIRQLIEYSLLYIFKNEIRFGSERDLSDDITSCVIDDNAGFTDKENMVLLTK